MKAVVFFALMLSGCSFRRSTVCTCDDYPQTAACESQCPLAEGMVTAVNSAQKTATVVIDNNGIREQKQVSLSQLPPAARPGLRFSALLKIDPKNGVSEFKRFIPESKILRPTH